MKEITKFSNEVCEELDNYVYRLVDPRNGKTFYVGRGVKNRVFDHAKGVLKNDSGENYINEEDDEFSLKLHTIKEIKDSGLEVINIIQKYGITKEQAQLLESVLIDVYGIEQLTNKVKGFGSDECPINAITLERNKSIKEYVEDSNDPKYIIIKVKEQFISERGSLYETVRSAWKVGMEKVVKYPYVLAVVNGIVREVYKVKEWHVVKEKSGRLEFTGIEEDGPVAAKFKGYKIPSRFRRKGLASPVLYSDMKKS